MLSQSQRSDILKTKNDISKLGLLIDDGRGRTVFDIRSLARRYKRTHGLDFVLIDHFSKIRPQRADRAAVEEISAELDDMKHELDCIVITLAQFSRASEREKRKPMMSDLRECGTLEQDADIILLLARHENDGVIDNNKRDIFCPKVRDGEANWDLTLGFNGPIYRFVDSHNAAKIYSRGTPEQAIRSQFGAKKTEQEENPF
jgi:replicative DNA helicase